MSHKTPKMLQLILLGVGAMNSPRYQPAGLFIQHGKTSLMIDGGGAAPKHNLVAWLVTDEQGELIRAIRKLARPMHLEPSVDTFVSDELSIEPHSVVHTSHAAYGYTIGACGKKIVWAPEFLKFPGWAEGADLMFAEAAAWNRPILFRGGVGGHAPVKQIARDAVKHEIKRLVFAHIGRPTIKALDAGKNVGFGEFGKEGDLYVISRKRISRRGARQSRKTNS